MEHTLKVRLAHRLAALVRASVAISHGNTSVVAGERLVRAIVRQSLSRARVLILITILFGFSDRTFSSCVERLAIVSAAGNELQTLQASTERSKGHVFKL